MQITSSHFNDTNPEWTALIIATAQAATFPSLMPLVCDGRTIAPSDGRSNNVWRKQKS